jgi:hypothetical protein
VPLAHGPSPMACAMGHGPVSSSGGLEHMHQASSESLGNGPFGASFPHLWDGILLLID